MPCSMTGFARQEDQHPWGSLSCEIRSVNHRYLEPSIRLHETLRSVEPKLRELLRKQLSRGKIEANIFLKTELAQDSQLGLNDPLADTIIALSESLRSKLNDPAKINVLDILHWPGVIKTAEIDSDEVLEASVSLFKRTLTHLVDNRAREGNELAALLEQRLQSIEQEVSKVSAQLPEILQQQQRKLQTKIEALKVEIDQERLAQEVVYIAQKSDVAEELDRLSAHIGEVRHTLKQKGPIGRRLDFLMQELNREANTLSSKSLSSDTTQSAVDVKVYIEQMREQVQNIE